MRMWPGLAWSLLQYQGCYWDWHVEASFSPPAHHLPPSPRPPHSDCPQALQAAAPSTDPALLLRKEQEAEEARRAALRAHGTPVTPETFLAWQEAFAAERALSSTAITEGVHAGAAQRLSGKKYFQMQESKHLQVEEEPSGSDEEGWDVPLERQGGAGDEDVDFDEEESSDDELLLEELAAGRGVQ